MGKTTAEKELLDLEKKYWQALKDKDVDTVLSLTDETCIVAGPQGIAAIPKQALAAMVKAATYTLHDFDVNDHVQVRLLRDDVAVVAYKVREKLTVEGKPVTMDAADTSTWIRRNGHWVCALHTESVLGDHFGRDRLAAKDGQPAT